MLTSLLLLTTLCALQDAGSEASAAPEPQDVAAPEAPQTTPDKVRTFLTEAQALLYDPVEAGLTSLAFELPIDMPAPIGAIGVVHVTWAKGEEPVATMTMLEGLELPPQVPPEALEAQALQQGKQFLGNMLNRPIGSLLDAEAGVATMAGVQDGLVAVDFAAKGAAEEGIVRQTFLFDESSLLKRSVTEAKAPGPMGEMEVSMSQDFTWKPAGGADGKLVIDSLSAGADFGFMQQKSEASFGYRDVGGILLPLTITTVTELPAMMGGGKQTRVLEARSLVVNGTPAPDTPPEPDAADVETARDDDAPQGG